ncbi:MAG TPA: aminotransferase class III-fold pyridoxal phosphate-dependent enzyme [Solirubrobacteraceae bacterium]|nr:aminotransferase class III-fold pyridoxal phosphate-dependent enzyme [Solirubrobacteraceae bacterium]
MNALMDLEEVAHEHLLMHFTRNGAFGPGRQPVLVLERGEGPYVFDTHGNRYFDALSALFCSQLGYSYGEELAAAAAAQMAKLPFSTVWSMSHPAAVELSGRLAELAPPGLGHVFYTGGGAESVESAWKIARLYHNATGGEQRTKAIARRVAYHGATLGALALTGVDGYKAPFGRPAIDVRHVSPTNRFRLAEDERFGEAVHDDAAFSRLLLDEIEAVVLEEGPETISMFIAEPVQNAGGCFVPPTGYWQGLRELADRYGFLVVADEVITAFGRLGEWFGSTRVGAAPDLITTAKGITSAYAPMGAVFAHDRVVAPLYDDPKRSLLHGITFAGHPLCAAISLKNLEIFERDRVFENVKSLEGHLHDRLSELLSLPIAGDVRGAGFFWAVELVGEDGRRFDAEEREKLLRGFMFGRLMKAGMIARPDDRGDAVVQVAPPLISSAEQLDEMVDALAEVLAEAGELMGLGVGSTTGAA